MNRELIREALEVANRGLSAQIEAHNDLYKDQKFPVAVQTHVDKLLKELALVQAALRMVEGKP
jgi:hypothetical protein